MKPVHWIGSSKRVVRSFPEVVREEIGYTVYMAQMGDKALNAVPLVGFRGSKVLEIVVDETGDTYRAVYIYTVKFSKAVYVLHAFQKKSKRGIATPLPDIRLIKSRLKAAEAHYRAHYDERSRKEQANGRSA